MCVHLHGIERAGCLLAVARVDPEVVHEAIDRVAGDESVVGIPDVTVVVDPFRRNRRAIDHQSAHGPSRQSLCLTQRSCRRSRACAGVSILAPMASTIVRAFSTSWALLA